MPRYASSCPQVAEYHRRLLEAITQLALSTDASAALAEVPRFLAAPRAFVTGDPLDATLGIAHYLCVGQDRIHAGLIEGVAAIRREFGAHVQALRARGDAASAARARDDEQCLRYSRTKGHVVGRLATLEGCGLCFSRLLSTLKS